MRRPGGDPGHQAERAAERHRRRPPSPVGRDAVEEQHDLGPFAQHGQPDRKAPAPTAAARRSRTSRPRRLAAIAISRPCRVIQILCQPSISTAAKQDRGVEHLLAHPLRPSQRSSAAPAATSAPQPSRPAMPPPIQAPRCAMPRLAASTMPTISAASSTSRKTMIAVASIAALPYFATRKPRVARMEIVEELVAAGLQRADIDASRSRPAGSTFSRCSACALELRRRLVCSFLIDQLDLDPGRNRHLGRHEPVIADRDRHLRLWAAGRERR